MFVLALYVLTTRWVPQRPPAGLFLVAGLVFAAAGDTALLSTGAVALFDGVALFLIAQVCHLLARLHLGAAPIRRRRWWIARSRVEYAMVALAIAVRLTLGVGTALFAVLDALIGLRIAPVAIPGDGYAVVGLYVVAQLLIAVITLSLIRQPRDLDSVNGRG